MTMTLRQRITTAAIVFMTNAAIVTAIIGCIVLNNTSSKHITESATAAVSEVATKIDDWISQESDRVTDLANIINYHGYATKIAANSKTSSPHTQKQSLKYTHFTSVALIIGAYFQTVGSRMQIILLPTVSGTKMRAQAQLPS